MRKVFVILLIILLTACTNGKNVEEGTPINGCDLLDDCGDTIDTENKTSFKEKYEFINNIQNSSGKIHREIFIDENHPFKQVEAEEIVLKIENKETFYAYVGDEMCPWCRSVIEKFIELSKLANIDTVYYVEIWDDEGNEILRDKYVLKEGKPTLELEGKESYQELLNNWESVLSDYTLTDEDGNTVYIGEKRIYAPNFFYVENGEIKRFTTGISTYQEDSRQELSEDILNDEENQFKEFFDIK